VEGTSTHEPKPGAAFWVVRAGRKGRYASDFEATGIAAIRFDPVGDVSGMSRDQVKDLVASERPGTKAKLSADAGMLYRFANEIAVDDIVIAPDAKIRELLFGEVAGHYEYRETPPVSDFRHVRRVRWLGRCSRDELPEEVLSGFGSRQTVFGARGHEDYLLALLRSVRAS
jgi:restriction system protein